MNTRFLNARAWLDEDGYHVWFSHDCLGGRDESKMPYPKWHAENGKVVPSFNCSRCGCHVFLDLEER